MKVRSTLYLLFIVISILLFQNCGFYLGKPKIEGEPDKSGLLLVDCGIGNSSGSSFVERLLGLDDPKISKGFLEGEDGQIIEGKGLKNLIIFSNLKPGNYKLTRIETEKEQKDESSVIGKSFFYYNYKIPESFSKNVNAVIEFGKPTYLGKLLIDENHDASYGMPSPSPNDYMSPPWDYSHECPDEDIYDIIYDEKAEIETLEKFLQYYKKSQWAGIVTKRLEELNNNIDKL